MCFGGTLALAAVCLVAGTTTRAPGQEGFLRLPFWKPQIENDALVEPRVEIDGRLQSGIQQDPLLQSSSSGATAPTASRSVAPAVPRPPLAAPTSPAYGRAVKVPLEQVVPPEVLGPTPVTPPGAEQHMLFKSSDVESVPAPPPATDRPIRLPSVSHREPAPGTRFMLFGGAGPGREHEPPGQRYMLFDKPAERSTLRPMTADTPTSYHTPFKLFRSSPQPAQYPPGGYLPYEQMPFENYQELEAYPDGELPPPPPSPATSAGTRSLLAPTSPAVGNQIEPGISSGVLSPEILSPEIVGEGTIIEGYPGLEPGPCSSCGCNHDPYDKCWNCHPFWGHFFRAFGEHDPHSKGVGYERVALAPFFVEASQPFTHFGLRLDNVYNWERPDRAEYLWAKIGGRGPPLVDSGLDFQQVRFTLEAGTRVFSAITSLPLNILDPDQNNNTAGLGDMSVATKTVFINGNYWQFSQITRTYFNTGLARRGLGNGHISMEPGLLIRNRVSDRTYWHNELKFWFPLGGDPVHSGEVFIWGTGLTTILYETDTVAFMPSFELHGWSVLDGQETLPDGQVLDIDPEGIFNIAPGMRFAYDNGGDLGLLEIGVASDIGVSGNRFYGNLLRVDFRWSY